MPRKPELEHAEAVAACPGHRWTMRFDGQDREIYCERDDCPATIDDLYPDGMEIAGGLFPVTLTLNTGHTPAGPWGPDEYDASIEIASRDLTDEDPAELSASQQMARAWMLWDQMTPTQQQSLLLNAVSRGGGGPLGSSGWASWVNADGAVFG